VENGVRYFQSSSDHLICGSEALGIIQQSGSKTHSLGVCSKAFPTAQKVIASYLRRRMLGTTFGQPRDLLVREVIVLSHNYIPDPCPSIVYDGA
jgi:hypothetical protein